MENPAWNVGACPRPLVLKASGTNAQGVPHPPATDAGIELLFPCGFLGNHNGGDGLSSVDMAPTEFLSLSLHRLLEEFSC